MPSAHTFASQGLTLGYVEWGRPGAPLLVLLHGVKDHARSWDEVARAFCDDWRVVALDLRGHGDSQWSADGGYLSSYHLLDLHRLLQAIGEGPATIVGHSFGGNIAARYAAAFPERVARLALVDGFGPMPEVFEEWARVGPAKRTRAWVEQHDSLEGRQARPLPSLEDAASRLRKANTKLSEAWALHLAEHGTTPQGEGWRWKCDPRVSVFPPEDFSADSSAVWRDIGCPTLLCYGVQSWNRNPASDGRAALLRDHRLAPIEDAGHWPHHDQPAAFVAALKAFLSLAT